MSTSAAAENPLPETSVVVLGGLLAGDRVMDWPKPEAASHRMLVEKARTYLAREESSRMTYAPPLRTSAPLSFSEILTWTLVYTQILHGLKRILGTSYAAGTTAVSRAHLPGALRTNSFDSTVFVGETCPMRNSEPTRAHAGSDRR